MVDYKLRGAGYTGVRLLDSPFLRQRTETLELYAHTPSNEDALKPLRDFAGIPTQAQGMPGWGPSIGQYFGSYAKLYRATGDERMREKCLDLFRGWCECVDRREDAFFAGTYGFDKLLGGLLDMYEFMGVKEVASYIRRMAQVTWDRLDPSIPRDGLQDDRMKHQIEWYTLPENLFRAYVLLGDEFYRTFAETWLYPHLWDKLAAGTDEGIGPRHAYSQVNSLSSAAMAYVVTGDEKYLDTITRGYDLILRDHTYATGGYGPAEMLFGEDPGYLGNALLSTWDSHYKRGQGIVYRNFGGGYVARSDAWGSCEVSCCTWAVMKLCNYLLRLTGDARFGEWAERLCVNGLLGQPPVTEKGQILYYASYFADGALKSYDDRRLQRDGQNFVWVCCTGTLPQDVAEYANMIAYFDKNGVYLSQFIPAEIRWEDRGVTLVSESRFPNDGRVKVTVHTETPKRFALRIRIPSWATEKNTVLVNGEPQAAACRPDTWCVLDREWQEGDVVSLDLPYHLYFRPVDREHPRLMALCWGPMVLSCTEMTVLVGDLEHPEKWIVPVEGEENVFQTLPGHTGKYKFITRRFRPYWQVGLMEFYYMYNYAYPDDETMQKEHQGM